MSDLPPEITVSVLVFDMAHTGEPDAERMISGFATLDDAQIYAEARMRASVEELRSPGITDAELRRLWYLYGEDCSVIGGDYRGSEMLDVYIAVPATPAECNWAALTPYRKRFHVILLVSNASNQSVWAGGYLRRFLRPTRDDLLAIYRQDIVDGFVRDGVADTEPVSMTVAHLYELPDPPTPPVGKPLRNWLVSVDFVCHDVKFGGSARGVFLWPEQPADWALRSMQHVLMADMMAVRGDGPDWANDCELIGSSVAETKEQTDYPLD